MAHEDNSSKTELQAVDFWHSDDKLQTLFQTATFIRGCIQKFPDWPAVARTANGTPLCR
jgi:hypothetical protein